MTPFIVSATICGALGALLLVALLVAFHRLNDVMTRRNLAGLERTQEYQSSIAYSGRVGPSVTLTGYSTRPFADAVTLRHYVDRAHDGRLLDGQYREYASSVPRVQRGTQTVRTFKRNRLGPGPATVGAVEIVHSTPHREPNAGADLLVPFGQAVVSAGVAALLCGVLAALAGRGDVLRIVGGVFVGSLAVAWLWRLGVVDSLLHVIETITQELEGDELADDPGHAMTINAGAARSDAARKERSSERALRLADLLAFAGRCATVGCAERSQGIRAGTPQQEAYRAKRDLLLDLGIGRWKSDTNHNLGWVLTVNPAEAAELLRAHVMDVSA